MGGSRGTVLLTFAESLAAPECAFSLVDAGYDVVLISGRGTTSPIRHVRSVRIEQVTSPFVDAFACVTEIEELARRIGAVALMPLDDAALWVCARAGKALGDTVIVGPSGAQLELALDKRCQLELAARVGFDTPSNVAGAVRPPGFETPCDHQGGACDRAGR